MPLSPDHHGMRSCAVHRDAGLHDSDFDADAEVSGSSSGDEAAASSGDEQPAAAGDPDSDIDAGLDDDMQPSSSSGADEAGGSVGEGSSDRGPQGNSSTDDDDGNPSSLPSNRQQQHASFLEGGKSASFAKAFAKIMAKPSKAAAAKAAAADVILSESASMAKRKAEVAADEAAAREAKKQRLELKKRGHFVSTNFNIPDRWHVGHDLLASGIAHLLQGGSLMLFSFCLPVGLLWCWHESCGTLPAVAIGTRSCRLCQVPKKAVCSHWS